MAEAFSLQLILDVDPDYCLMALCGKLTSLAVLGDSPADSTRGMLGGYLQAFTGRILCVACY
jgi:hypothetical protein